jgi:diguanylate cyclase (GGDEF)-like protein
VARVRADGRMAPFAHDAPDGRRLAHHLRVDPDDQPGTVTITGLVEPLDRLRGALDASPRDPLTGLDDGHGARRWIEARLAGAEGVNAPLTLIVVGIDRLYMVNEAFGRSVGDTIIRSAARRIERQVGRSGHRRLVARLAGAQFAIGLPAPADLADAEVLANEIAEALGRPFPSGDHMVTLSVRVGIAAANAGETDAGAVMRRASLALADAEDSETARIRVFTSDEETRRAENHRLELDLRRALDEDRIEVVWQPQVSVPTGRIVGVEALARWQHPALGELGAEALFAAAERSDYLVQLSEHVQRKAISEAAAWPESLSRLRMAVNVTAADIARPGFSAHMLAIVDAAGLSRARVTVEITESGLIEDLSAAAALLAALRAGGLRVAIDDFGTGYSSLAYLKALPLDYLKLDRALAQDIAGSQRDRIVVRSVIDMARSLGLSVIAEGVETEEQLALLAQEGCNLYQGFLCSPPVDVKTLESLVGNTSMRGMAAAGMV